MAGIIKVAIHYNSESFFYNLNSKISLAENICGICESQNISGSDSWGLKRKEITEKNKNKPTKNIEEYYYIEDFSTVQNGDELKLVTSIPVKLSFIFRNYNISFADLAKENSDKLFLKYLVQYQNQTYLLNYILEDEVINKENLKVCYQTILQILKYGFLDELPMPIVEKMIDEVKNCKVDEMILDYKLKRERPHILECIMSILCQLMVIRECSVHIKEEIALIPITQLISMCRLRSMKFQLKPLKLLNSIVTVVKDEGKWKMLKEMDSAEFRNVLFEHLIQDLKKCNDAIGKEVYVYQCHILSRLMDKLVTSADPEILKQFECNENSENRLSDILEFQEDNPLNYKGKWGSNDTVISSSEDSYRYSFLSVSSRDSISTLRSFPKVDEGVCKLTEECLVYYAGMYEMNFNQSKLEELANQSKITISADKIVKMLASILRIGSKIDKKREDFQPLVFNTSLKQGFFLELFCRTMWLLSKTRREMQAHVADDFDKVLNILELQVRRTLEWKPLTLAELLKQMKTLSYNVVCNTLEKEAEINWKNNLNKNPCVQLLKKHFSTDNEDLVRQQRLSVLKAGQDFPKLPEVKKKQQYFSVELSQNCKQLLYYDCNNNVRKAFQPIVYNISAIRHLIIGISCPYYKENIVKNSTCLFALQFEGDTYIHFLAKDEKMAQYWMDGLHILLGKNDFSDSYKKELEELTNMDIALQLLELQNVEIPDQPPPLPLVPPRPPLPPRPVTQLSNTKNNY
ncbi:engulfment and cell motility protein 1-like [Onthophagus taurus]|uniref:engulfment and cell motility protein 1-like n=1 Tax=Onthophagus taurus TaxID=166361 RepID=UPI000C20A4F4|nr:engulfment and cell motility protein 1-like [Onthophagus taurus]